MLIETNNELKIEFSQTNTNIEEIFIRDSLSMRFFDANSPIIEITEKDIWSNSAKYILETNKDLWEKLANL